MILYVLIGLTLASFVIAYFSARTWHWGHVIVVELIFLSAFGFFLLAAEVVRINAVYRTQINKDQKELDRVAKQNNALRYGDSEGAVIGELSGQDPPVKMTKDEQGNDKLESIADLDHKLLIATRLRGRIWGVPKPGRPNPQTGVVTLPTPAGIKAQTVVYLFDDGPPQPPAANGAPRGPQFLGEFTVTQVGPQQTTLQPVLAMDELERRRLAASPGPWIIYETMPIDRHEVFTGKPADQLQKLLPKKSVGEYIRDKKDATKEDDPIRVVGIDESGKPVAAGDAKATKKIYERRLRDYAAEFDELARRRIAAMTEADSIRKDIARLTEAEAAAKKIQAFRENERTKLTAELAGVKKERAAIEKHLAEVNKLLAHARQLTDDLMRRNEQLAAELAARQQVQAPVPGGGTSTPAGSTAPLVLGSVK